MMLDEDEITDEKLAEVVKDINDRVGIESGLKLQEYLHTFNAECMYTKFTHVFREVNEEMRNLWLFQTGNWNSAETFILTLIEKVPAANAALQRYDKGGNYFFDFEEVR